MSADGEILARVGHYREATRMAVRVDASFKDRCLALLDLADMARGEVDPTIRTWAERAVWEESKVFLGVDDAEPDLPPPSYEQRARQMRCEGLVACRECFHPLPSDEELDRWELQRRRYAELLEVREGAVDR